MTWLLLSFLRTAFVAGGEAGLPPVVINEIHYHAPDDDGHLEFVELFNRTDGAVDLHGWALVDGVRYRFDRARGPTVLHARRWLVVARDPAALAAAAGIAAGEIAGPFDGQLSNRGERIVLADDRGAAVDALEYAEDGDWPARADGLGSSLERVSSDARTQMPQNWAASRPRGLRGLLAPLGLARSGADWSPGQRNSVAAASPPPLVTFLERVPREPGPNDAVTVRVRVEGACAGVTLEYDAGEGPRPLSMSDDGAAPDRIAGDGIYAVALPPAAHGSVVRFCVAASNAEGGSFRVPREGNAAAHLAYYVLRDPPPESEQVDVFHLLWDGALSCASGAWLGGATFVHRGTAYVDVGLKYRGQTSCGMPKTGLKVAFARGARFGARRRLNLLAGWQDRTLLREKLAWDLFRAAGHPYCEARMAAVYERTGAHHGLFVTLEEPDAGFLRRNALDAGETLWKSYSSFLGDEERRPGRFELLVGDGGPARERALRAFERQVNTLEGEALVRYLLAHLDIERFLDYQAIKCVLSDEDAYSKNWLLYQEAVGDTGGDAGGDEAAGATWRFTVLPWDLDLSFGQLSLYDEELHTDRHPLGGTVDHPRTGSHGMRWNGLVEAVFGRRAGDYFVRALYGRIWRLLEGTFHPRTMHANIDLLAAATDTLATEDLARWPRWGDAPSDPRVHREALRRYVTERWVFLRAFLLSDQPTSARETGPWAGKPPRTASGIVPPRATAYRTFRYVPAPRLVLAEIHYHPAGDEALEFFELANLEDETVDVSGWSVPAVGFTFPSGSTVGARARVVVARQPEALRAAHPTLAKESLYGPWSRRLANGGETLRLVDAGIRDGRRDHPETIDVVRYGDRAPWPPEADGSGHSLELRDLALDNDLPENWRPSPAPGGSPGR